MHLSELGGLQKLAVSQHGVVTRTQLRGLGASHAQIDSQLDARRWSQPAPAIVLLHNHVPTREQWAWIALLDAGPVSALCSHSSLELHGMKSFAKEASSIHVIVPRGAKVTKLPNVEVHESRRFAATDKRWQGGFPCLDVRARQSMRQRGSHIRVSR